MKRFNTLQKFKLYSVQSWLVCCIHVLQYSYFWRIIQETKKIGCSQKTPYKSGPYSLPLRKVLFEIVFEGPQAGTTLKFFFSKTFLLDEFRKNCKVIKITLNIRLFSKRCNNKRPANRKKNCWATLLCRLLKTNSFFSGQQCSLMAQVSALLCACL